ncbi:unnamed protein product [Nippostrongylus brasiliensis]|uniref:Secreted protein n=1 Tax=Nippostrongylus brasiliensis TaxID=27835 RepID=A0A0N4Y230_NIPBR|nr:unnamed protein product [Nippostrongylus brasiliensis]
MRSLALLIALSPLCLTGPVGSAIQEQPGSVELLAAKTAYALDLDIPVLLTGFQCIQKSSYNVVFIRGYAPTGSGQVDQSVVSNVRNANAGKSYK